MSLHHTQKTKYLKLKDQGLTPEELKREMLANNILDADADQFIAEAYADDQSATATLPDSSAGEQPRTAAINTADALGAAAAKATVTVSPTVTPEPMDPVIPKFNYKALEEEHYAEYLAYVASLPLFDQHTFQCFRAERVMKERYPGMPSSPWDVVGIRIINDTPVHTTKIDIKTANELNAQLPNSKRIYLLAQ